MDDNNYYVFVFCVPHNIMYDKCVCVRMHAFVRACVCVCVRACAYVRACVCVCYRDLKGQKHVTTITTDSCKGQSTEVRFLEHVQCRITLKFHPRGSIVLHLTSPQVYFLILC